ncbi:MAG: hypothetical protein FJ290_12435 [Planctomycetes bacterium]|nr:hypothetical protein [Planctomycetota bacterium]
MGTFHVSCRVENHVHRSLSAEVPKILVGTESECTWVSAETLRRLRIKVEKKDMTFVMANGKTLSRGVGFAVIGIGEHVTIDEVVFGQEGDLQLLGARTLEGLNLVVDPTRKRLVAGGPVPAALVAHPGDWGHNGRACILARGTEQAAAIEGSACTYARPT